MNGPEGTMRRHGAALKEPTDACWGDPVVGTPWNKYVPARPEGVG